MKPMDRWDNYFLMICNEVAQNSKCYSRQIGAILVIDNIIISTGYNGPPRGVPNCGDRLLKDNALKIPLNNLDIKNKICPRRLLQFKSGEGLEFCPAIHAEKNCLLAAARNGIRTKNAIMYMNANIVSCTQCFGALINSGIKELVLVKNNIYDITNKWVIDNSDIKIREFK
jgi:dCMP deaminase